MVSKRWKLCLLLFSLAALQACQREVNHSYQHAALYNTQLGLAYLKRGDTPRAKQKLLWALQEAPTSPKVHAAMAYYFEQTQEWDMAEKHYRKAMNLSPTGAQFNNYGAFLCGRKRYAQAEYYFAKAIDDTHYVNTAKAYENAGLCATASGHIQKAEWYYQKALAQDYKNPSLQALVKLYQQQGRNQEAVALLKHYQTRRADTA